MKIVLFDTRASWEDLLPLTYTRPVAELRVGILTLREKWESFAGLPSCTFTRPYLRAKYPCKCEGATWINAAVLPSEELVDYIQALREGERLLASGTLLAFRPSMDPGEDIHDEEAVSALAPVSRECPVQVRRLTYPWDVFSLTGEQLAVDFGRITMGRSSAAGGVGNTFIGEQDIFIEEGARVNGAIINATAGPVYIGRDAEVMEGSVIRGSFSMCPHSVLKLSAKVYGPSSIGPHCKVGGEISNVVFLGYANKAHDGFLGNAVIGEWCNLGADTNNSNLKNTYQEVRAWNYRQRSFVATGLQFCGLIMGDHSKTAINTMFNTGTVVGVNANIFGAGFPRTFIPSYTWGGPHGTRTYTFEKAIDVARAVMARRGIELDHVEEAILRHVFDATQEFRKD